MNSTEVTRDGLRNLRPEREAVIGTPDDGPRAGRRVGSGSDSEAGAGWGAGGGGRGGGGRRGGDGGRGRGGSGGGGGRGRGRGERLMVPEAVPTSYYGQPVLNQPTWEALDIAGYFFLGGLAGASSVLSAACQMTDRPRLARRCKVSAFGAISLSAAALVHDLGRPSRFYNMLRVLKPTSPMSVGSWLLAAYAPAAGVAALSAVTGTLPILGTAATAGAAIIGPAVAAYTGVLVADTAVPAWHEGWREMPFVFVSSAAASAAGLGLLAGDVADSSPARRLAVAGGAAELVGSKLMERRMGVVGEPYRRGRAGRLMRAAEALTAAGAVGAAVLGGRNRLFAAASGAALLAGSCCTRFGIFEAGVQSAKDSKYTVGPQRARLEAGAGN